jgi:hypothetical protein
MGRSVAVLSVFCLHGQKSAGLLGLHFTVAGCCSQPDETVRCLVRVQSVARGERISLLFWASQHRFVQQVVEKAEQRARSFFPFRRLTSSRIYQVLLGFCAPSKSARALGDCAQESHAPPARERQCPSARPRKLQRTAKEIWLRRSLPFGNLFSWHAAVALKRQLCLFGLFFFTGEQVQEGELSFFGGCMIRGCKILWRRQNIVC